MRASSKLRAQRGQNLDRQVVDSWRGRRQLLYSFLLLGFCLLPLGVGAQAIPAGVPPSNITVVADDDYPPYCFRDAKGALRGIVPESWLVWEKTTRIKVKLLGMDWDKALLALQEGEVDVIDAICFTAQKAQHLDYSEPYAQVEVCVYFSTNYVRRPELSSLTNIAAKAGDHATIEELKARGMPSILKYNTYEQMIHAAVQGQVDAMAIDQPPALYYLGQFRVGQAFLEPLVLYTGTLHRAVLKGRQDLLARVEAGFAKSQPACRAITGKWLGDGFSRSRRVRMLLLLVMGLVVLLAVLGIFTLILQRRVKTKTARLNELVEHLSQSEEQYRSLVENLNVGVYRIAIENGGRFLQANSALAKMLGYDSVEELMAVPVEDLYMDPWDRQQALSEIHKYGFYRNTEVLARKKDGSPMWVTRSAQAKLNEQGQVEWLDGIVVDITERKQAEARLREQADRIKSIFRTAPSGIGVVMDRVIQEVNERLCEMTGYTREELLGQSSRLLYPTNEDFDYVGREKYRQIAEKGIGIVETRWQKKTGEVMEIILCSTPIDPSNLSFGVTFAALDITDRKRAEEALRVSNEYLKAILASINDALFIVDVETCRILDVNRSMSELYGYSHDEALSLDMDQLSLGLSPYSRQEALEWLRKAREEGPQIFEWIARHRLGRTFWVEVSLRFAVLGQQERFLVVVRDIEERKRVEADRLNYERQLQQTQKLESLGVLAGGIAHDFNNLLTVILGNLQLVLARMAEPDPAREHILEIEKATHRAADLAKQMLTYSGKGHFVAQPLDLRDIAIDITHILQASISKKAELRFTGQEKLPLIQGDPAQIRQVVMNLVINASEALGDRPGLIEVSTGTVERPNGQPIVTRNNEPLSPGLYVYLEVKDTGSGIEEKNLAKIFDPFFTTKFTGRGLGLAAVMGVVGGHKGGIEVNSQPGQGTTIRVLFPALAQPESKPAVEEKSASSWRGQGLVLLVDDEAGVLLVTKKLLEFLGFSVLTAVDGIEALNVFRAHSDEVLCVLLDLTMPRMDGQEAFHEMKRIQPDVCVVVCSGYSEQDVVRRFEGQSIAGFLQKPFSLEALRALLQRISQRSAADAEARKRRMK